MTNDHAPEDEPDGAPTEAEWEAPTAVEIPIDGTLDLHTFSPREIKPLISDYLDECAAHGIFEVRIIHGKGQGVLRRIVHAALKRHARVRSFQAADESAGGWGATIVFLDPQPGQACPD